MKEKFTKWDAVEYLQTEEDILLYLEACIEENGSDPAYIAKALGNIARARNMSQLAKDVDISRPGLYKALSGEGNPSFEVISKVANALGLQIGFTSAAR
ncbi:MAG: putative addiction module antidote protein [Gammaproteobacteria bacterium]|nr:MAG: putative addiction module antidote protein [Gammaproteobacteria bacterium]